MGHREAGALMVFNRTVTLRESTGAKSVRRQ